VPNQVETSRRRRRRRAARRRRYSLPVYRGRFRAAQAERLLWRAGFGPRPGEAARLARKGLDGAVYSLTRPGPERLRGPDPIDQEGRPLAPTDAYGHDQLWWLDKMVRTSRPLVERMTLVWHDWFATSNDEVGSARLMIGQNNLFRRRALGSFAKLLMDVTRDPAMLIWLSGSGSTKDAPNENYSRELMELFTLGLNHGYSERDVREQARALTGFTHDWDDNIGPVRFRFEPELHDGGVKRIFGKRGRFGWRDSCRLCLEHKSHPSFFVGKLWSYFVPTPPPPRTARALERLYVESRYQVRPVLEAILRHPALYEGPRMVKPPIVFIAGMLRALGRGIDSDGWGWLANLAGQQLFYPPDVAGWDDDRWLDTSTWRGRWQAAAWASRERILDPNKVSADPTETPARAVDRALGFWGNPSITRGTRAALERFATRCRDGANRERKQQTYPLLCQNALRMMIAISPDLHTC
jgi:uncharacterized protein (DUF1800 family)